MTAAEWRACEHPGEMLTALRGADRLTARKWRLLAIACFNRVASPRTDERARDAVAVAERFADGGATAGELAFAFAFGTGFAPADEAGRDSLWAAAWAAHDAADGAATTAAVLAAYTAAPAFESRAQCHLLRDIFGDPFRPVAFHPSWRTPTAVAIAAGMYDARDFAAMPILADALQDAGCEDDAVLAHCREPGVHVRGCWVVDGVLGKG